MENIKNKIEEKLEKIDYMIKQENNKKNIDLERKELDKLLKKYIKTI